MLLSKTGGNLLSSCTKGSFSFLKRFLSSGPLKLSFSVFDGKSDAPKLYPPLILLHGLFGAKKNFESIAKNLSQTGRQVITVDARNHGDSPHSPVIDYFATSEDLELLLKDLNLKSAIFLGHSFGGKAAMALALTKPHLVDLLIVEDISPTPSRSDVASNFPQYIEAMKSVEFGPEITNISLARQMASKQLMQAFPEKSLRDFIVTNVDQRNGRYGWRINLEAIENNFHHIIDFPQFSSSFPLKTIFIGGSKSDMIRESDLPSINRLFPKAVIRYIEGAGHWAHSEKPHEFIEIVKECLLEYESDKNLTQNRQK